MRSTGIIWRRSAKIRRRKSISTGGRNQDGNEEIRYGISHIQAQFIDKYDDDDHSNRIICTIGVAYFNTNNNKRMHY